MIIDNLIIQFFINFIVDDVKKIIFAIIKYIYNFIKILYILQQYYYYIHF